jgi:hypothetical protein
MSPHTVPPIAAQAPDALGTIRFAPPWLRAGRAMRAG